jgi:APA family basic amino acid/polyamine antiporter
MASLTERMFRRTPLQRAAAPDEAEGEHLQRSIGLFSLTMFGVGATIGTGIFFVLNTEVPVVGPAVIFSFLLAAFVAGLTALCYASATSRRSAPAGSGQRPAASSSPSSAWTRSPPPARR